MLTSFLSLAKDGLLVGLQGAAALGLGLAALQPLKTLDFEERLLFSLGIGYLALALGTFALGIFGLLYTTVVGAFWIFAIACGALSWKSLRPPGEPAISVDKDFWSSLMRPWPFFGLFAAAMAANFLFSYAPPIMDDSVFTYLALPQAYAKAHRLVEIPENAHAYFPASIEMLYAQLLLWAPAESAKLLNWLFGILSALAAGLIAWRHLGVRRVGLVLATFYTMPWIASLSGSGKIDLGSLFFALLACQALLLVYEGGHDECLPLSALMAGAHFATKYTGGAMVAALFIAALPHLIREGRNDLKRPILSASLFCVLAMAPILPWLIRNLALKGNPIFPAHFLGIPGDYYIHAVLRNMHPLSFMSYLAYVYDFLSFGDIIWGTGPLLWALAPFLLLKSRQIKNTGLWRLWILGATHFLICVAARQEFPLTGFFPGLSLLSVASAAWLDRLWDSRKPLLKTFLWLSLLFPGTVLSIYFGAKRLPLFLNLQSRESFIAQNWNLSEDYDTYRFINDHIPKGEKILFTSLNVAPGYFYPDHRVLGLGAYPPGFYSKETTSAVEQLRIDGVRYVVTSTESCVWGSDGTCCRPEFAVCLSFINPKRSADIFETLARGQRSALYRIKD